MAYKSLFNWSGGKDSALALYHTMRNPDYDIQQLLTSVNSTYNRVSMHGVRTELLDQQAAALGFPLTKLLLADQPSMQDYEKVMETTMASFHEDKYTHSVFGDIFLEDLRRYREEQLAAAGFSAYFPLWKKDTTDLIHEFLDLGFKTIVVCTKSELLDSSFAGRVIDRDFLKDLPSGVDPCGENGEFHTFVFDGPIFREPVAFETGEKVYREYKAPQSSSDNCGQATGMGFWFCDLLPLS